ncbi:hypothetical protein TNCV_900681 [Trichonephila clavipes]|nr:hypothetical protein TNCV_900681 [Trichonephila clavipes]
MKLELFRTIGSTNQQLATHQHDNITVTPHLLFGLKKIETEIMKEDIDMNQLSILKTQIMDNFQRLDTCQNQISEQLLDLEDAMQEYLGDMEDAEKLP